MKLYKWEGHRDESMLIMANLPHVRLVYMTNDIEAMLLHESPEGTVLPNSTAYEILNAVGDINNGYFAVFNNIPVSKEETTIFESRFIGRAKLVDNAVGFVAIRVLRPLNSDTYIILTLWEDEESYTNWQKFEEHGIAHAKRGTEKDIDKQPNTLLRPSFVKTYKK